MMLIDRLTLYRLHPKLVTPYRLTFGAVTAFDTVLCVVESNGRTGFGEATILNGYTDETIDDAWATAQALARDIIGRDFDTAKTLMQPRHATHPFTVTALITALEMLEEPAVLAPPAGARAPLLAILNKSDLVELHQEIEDKLQAGYKTFKFKCGFDVERDLKMVACVCDMIDGRARLRLDCNQGFDRAEALAFVDDLLPHGIELLEQPCAKEDWTANTDVARAATVPVMFDESIYGPDDIHRAADAGAAYVKLKLMKAGSLTHLMEELALIRSLEMIPVLGNGVANDPGCWMEACVAHRMVDTAGEMNGFLKPHVSLFKEPMTIEDGDILLPSAPPELIDPQSLVDLADDHRTFDAA